MSGSAIIVVQTIPRNALTASNQRMRSSGVSLGPIWASTMTSPISRLSVSELGARKSSTLAIHRAQCRCSMPCHTSRKNSLLTSSTNLSRSLPAPSQRHKVQSKCFKTSTTTTRLVSIALVVRVTDGSKTKKRSVRSLAKTHVIWSKVNSSQYLS